MICEILTPVSGNGTIIRPVFYNDIYDLGDFMEQAFPWKQQSQFYWNFCCAGGYDNAIILFDPDDQT